METVVPTSFLAHSCNKSNVQCLSGILLRNIWVNDELSQILISASDQREASDWQILENEFFGTDKFMKFMCTFSFPKSQTKCAI